MQSRPALKRRPVLAVLYSAPIGVLGGLIGLGGAELRLPLLAGPLGYAPRKAVPLNLAVSFITLLTSLAIRGRALSLVPLAPFLLAILAMITGAVTAAFIGTQLAGKLSDEKLERIILILLVAIGFLLIVEGFLPRQLPAFIPVNQSWHVIAGFLFGLLIGLVSSLLGVAGGELIIPTLVFAFGADIKTAGTASLIISIPAVFVGVMRYWSKGALGERRDFSETILPMSFGSIIGAIMGGVLVGIIPDAIMKVVLGIILNVSAWRIFKHHQSRPATQD